MFPVRRKSFNFDAVDLEMWGKCGPCLLFKIGVLIDNGFQEREIEARHLVSIN